MAFVSTYSMCLRLRGMPSEIHLSHNKISSQGFDVLFGVLEAALEFTNRPSASNFSYNPPEQNVGIFSKLASFFCFLIKHAKFRVARLRERQNKFSQLFSMHFEFGKIVFSRFKKSQNLSTFCSGGL